MGYMFGASQQTVTMKTLIGGSIKFPVRRSLWENGVLTPDDTKIIADGFASIVGQSTIADRTAKFAAEREVISDGE